MNGNFAFTSFLTRLFLLTMVNQNSNIPLMRTINLSRCSTTLLMRFHFQDDPEYERFEAIRNFVFEDIFGGTIRHLCLFDLV